MIATIISGPLKGAKVIGSATIQNTELKVAFSKINFGSTTGVFNATAIDAETAESIINGNKDKHYLERYGLLFATSFMEGIGDAVLADIEGKREAAAANQSTVDANGNPLPVTYETTNWGDRAIAALSDVGDTINTAAIAEYNSIPELTITVPAGKLIGILLTSDYTDQRSQ